MKSTPKKALTAQNVALVGVGVVAVGGTLYYLLNSKASATTPNGIITGSSSLVDELNVSERLKTTSPILSTLTATTVSYSGVAAGATILLYANGVYANASKISDGMPLTGLTLQNGTAYSITATESGKDESNASNAIVYSASGAGGTVTPPIDTINVTSFINILKTIPFETANGKYNPHYFPIVGVVSSIDPKISATKEYPNWVIAWQCEGGNFKNNNRKTPQLGIPFMYDRLPTYYSGYGERGLDFVYDMNPDNGCFWGQERDANSICQGTITNVDTEVNKNWQTFVSRIPFHERAYANFGLAGDDDKIRWDNFTLEQCFDDGINAASANMYGHGDTVGGVVNTGLTNADIEINYELGESGTNKHAAFMMGMAMRSQGAVFSQYSGAFSPITIAPHFYPDSNGNYPSNRLNIDRTTKYENNQPIPNTVPQSSDWNPNNRFSISGRGITNKSLYDYANAWMCAEISSLASEAFRQGETYDKTGNGNMVTVNKYGSNANTQHIIAYVRHVAEINKWWSIHKLNNRRVIMQTKITCDRSNLGIFYDAGFTNTSLQFYHHGRRYAHMMGGLTALNGCEWNVWDRNTDKNLDGYHGALAAINLMKQKKDFGNGVSESFETLKTRMNFLLWDSEISYDNGITYKKETSDKYVFDDKSIIQSQGITNDGYWGGYLARSEGGENTTCKLRVQHNGTYYYHTVTADMWESTSKEHENTPLSEIPIKNKDYHYFLIKVA